MTGYELLPDSLRQEMDDLTERRAHAATMRFSVLDAKNLNEFERLCDRLAHEYEKEIRPS